ncbi:MAG: S49 family peptidase [Pseudorhodoplanes sp.]|nr:S49 family peptidase [Pseudorhodoplanes sp.]
MAKSGIRSRFLDRLIPARFRAGPLVPVVRLSGVIGLSTPLKPGLTLAGVARLLDTAFKPRKAEAVAIVINSPGGSAVQSHLIFSRIRQLADERGLPVIAFIEDVGASGGYMIACAADEIVCDPSSIVGSIGVIGATFGFEKALKKLGIERRVYTAGKYKSTLDPFLPEKPEDVHRLKAIQKDIHDMFISLVRSRRGRRLKGPDSVLFSGEYWIGGRAQELGLVDRVGEIRNVLRERFGKKVVTPLVVERGWFGRRIPGVGIDPLARPSLADELVSAIEERAIWARYGL